MSFNYVFQKSIMNLFTTIVYHSCFCPFVECEHEGSKQIEINFTLALFLSVAPNLSLDTVCC